MVWGGIGEFMVVAFLFGFSINYFFPGSLLSSVDEIEITNTDIAALLDESHDVFSKLNSELKQKIITLVEMMKDGENSPSHGDNSPSQGQNPKV